jgi:hypothetical protein
MPGGLERAELQHLGAAGRVRAQEAKRAGDLGARPRGRRFVEIGLVDDHEVGQLHHALLDGLKVVAGVGQLQQHEAVGHAGHGGFALAHADGLDDHDIVPGGLAGEQGLARHLGHAAERAAARAGADEGTLVHRELLHARLVAEDAATGQAAAGVHGEHGHTVAVCHEEQTQGFDEGALADTGHAAQADAQAAAGVRQQGVQQGIGLGAVVGAGAFQQGDGLGQRAALGRAVRGLEQGFDKLSPNGWLWSDGRFDRLSANGFLPRPGCSFVRSGSPFVHTGSPTLGTGSPHLGTGYLTLGTSYPTLGTSYPTLLSPSVRAEPVEAPTSVRAEPVEAPPSVRAEPCRSPTLRSG